jgi:hypothetical protein
LTGKNTPVYLNRDQILKADDLPSEEVEVPEWSGTVRVRGLSGKGRDEYWASMTVQRGKTQTLDVANATAKLVARCVVGEDGEPLFTQNDVHALGERSGAALNRVFEVASRLSGISDDDMDEAGKASESTPNGGSTSS